MDRGPDNATVLRLVNQPRRMISGSLADLREVWVHRELLRAFVARELRSRYKGTRLGWAWALVRPLVMLFVYGLAVGVFLGAGRLIPQFMLFIYSGLLAWGFFSALVMGCINSVVQNGALLAKASFPRILLPIAVAVAAMVDFVLQASVLLIGYLFVRDAPELLDLLWLPPAFILLLVTGLATGLILAAVNVYARDTGFLVDVALQVGFWVTPILYSYGQVVRGAEHLGITADWLTRLYMLNPMANVVIAFQKALWPAADAPAAADFAFPGQLEDRLIVFTLIGFLITWIGMRFYIRMSGNFGQEF